MLATTDSSGTTTYIYDDFSNLRKITFPSGKIVEYKVDGFNRRVKKLVNGVVTEYYIWYDQIHLAAVLDGSKVPQIVFMYGPESNSPAYVLKGGVTYRVIADPALGSIRFLVNTSDLTVAQEISYDEFGNVVSDSNPGFQPLGFAGGLGDVDSGLIRFWARDYDSSIGRWTTRDPIGFFGGDANLYSYVRGNPTSYVDPTGLKFSFRDKESERLFNDMREKASTEARTMLDALEASDSFVVNVGSNALTGLIAGSSGYTYKDGNSAYIMLAPEVYAASALSGQALLLHEIVHANQIMTGELPLNGKLSENDPVRMQKKHQGIPCP